MIVLFIVPIWGALFLAALILSIITIAQKRTGPGIALLLCSLLVPPLAGAAMGLILMGAVCAPAVVALSEMEKSRATVGRAAPIRDVQGSKQKNTASIRGVCDRATPCA